MPDNYLAQYAPTTTNLENAYVAPRKVFLMGINVANRASPSATIHVSVAIAPNGVAHDVKHFIIFKVDCEAGKITPLPVGVLLSTADTVRVQSDDSDVTFTLVGG